MTADALPASGALAVGDADLERDGPALLALNNAAVPAVNALQGPDLAALAAMGAVRVVRDAARIDGFAVLMPPGTTYESENYAWFAARYDDFLYVDRVVVAEGAQRRGVGRAIYDDAIAQTRREGRGRLVAEVNVRPPNPRSRAFHERLGFAVVRERENVQSGKRVAMLVRDVPVIAGDGRSVEPERSVDRRDRG